MKLKPGMTVYYAQVKTPKGFPPTARILSGVYRKTTKQPGKVRIFFDHTPYGLEVETRWLSRSIMDAQALLTERVQLEIRLHQYQIDQLTTALQSHAKTVIIGWPGK